MTYFELDSSTCDASVCQQFILNYLVFLRRAVRPKHFYWRSSHFVLPAWSQTTCRVLQVTVGRAEWSAWVQSVTSKPTREV